MATRIRERVSGLHVDDVATALGEIHWRGAEIVGGSEPEIDLLARAVLTYLAARDRRQAEGREGARRRESSQRIAADLAEVRCRVAAHVAAHGGTLGGESTLGVRP